MLVSTNHVTMTKQKYVLSSFKEHIGYTRHIRIAECERFGLFERSREFPKCSPSIWKPHSIGTIFLWLARGPRNCGGVLVTFVAADKSHSRGRRLKTWIGRNAKV